MTEEEYILQQTNKERKQLAKQAKYVNRRGKGAVRLGSDKMTKKELEAMNGECKTYDLGRALWWEEFKELPAKYQQEYLDILHQKFGRNSADLGFMFGVHPTTVRGYCKTHNLESHCHDKGSWDGSEADVAWHKFLETISGTEEPMETDIPIVKELNEMPPIKIKEQNSNDEPINAVTSAVIDNFTISLCGTPIQIFEMLHKLCGDNEYHITITGFKKEEIPRWANQVETKSST